MSGGAAPPGPPATDMSTAAVPHPAKFSPNVLTTIRAMLVRYGWPDMNVLDPFVGVGLIHELRGVIASGTTWCIEIEPEWAAQSCGRGFTWCGDFFDFQPPAVFMRASGDEIATHSPDRFDAIITSVTYGNRMADHHNARDTSSRITYRHKLGRPLTEGNSGMLQWGKKYRQFHTRAYVKFTHLLEPGGLIMVNVSDHIRQREVVSVSDWHHNMLSSLFTHLHTVNVPTQRMGMGANRQARVEFEQVHVYRMD